MPDPADARTVPAPRKPLLVVGLHQRTEAYPNTLHRILGLRARYDVREINIPLWTRFGDGVAAAPLRLLGRALRAHAGIWWALLRQPRAHVAYVPYPAPSVAILLSLLPRRRRPARIVLDGFISLYDTMVNDRGLLKRGGWRARLLGKLERRAFALADAVVVDTAQNAAFYAQTFELPQAHFVPVALATNESDYRPVPYVPRDDVCRVLYIGTLVPLHGIDVIVEAAKMLATHPGIAFRFVGDGQQAGLLERAIDALPRATWDRSWKSPAALAAEIAEADLCLGVFGSGDKAQRVCPLKVYAYAAVGRAVVTGDTRWLREDVGGCHSRPFLGIEVANADALSVAIASLAMDPGRREDLAGRARAFYQEALANEKAIATLATILNGSGDSNSDGRAGA